MSAWDALSPAEIDARIDQIPQAGGRTSTPKCGALKASGGRCAAASGANTDHKGYGRCSRHNGASPAGRQHAHYLKARERADAAHRAVAFLGTRKDVTPEQVMLDELNRTYAVVRWLEAVLRLAGWRAGLDEAIAGSDPAPDMAELTVVQARIAAADAMGIDLLRPETEDPFTSLPQLIAVHSTEKALGFTDTEFAAWFKVFREERAHLAKHAKACLDANVAERMTQVAESRREFQLTVLRASMQHLAAKATPAQIDEALAVGVRAGLQQLAASSQ